MPILSIITINLNNASELKNTMKSVFEQTDIKKNQVEYIVVDGASRDDSIQVIKDLESEYKKSPVKLKWISEKDNGIYDAMNKGIKMAAGSLIGIMNSGDSYLSNIFSDIIIEHKNNPDSILYGAIKTFEKGKFESIWGWSYKILPKQMIAHPGTFVPKSIYDKYGLFDTSFKIAGDYDSFLKYYKNKEKFIFLDKIIANFNLEGISSTTTELADKESDIVRKRYGYYIPPTKKQLFKKHAKEFVKTIFPFLR